VEKAIAGIAIAVASGVAGGLIIRGIINGVKSARPSTAVSTQGREHDEAGPPRSEGWQRPGWPPSPGWRDLARDSTARPIPSEVPTGRTPARRSPRGRPHVQSPRRPRRHPPARSPRRHPQARSPRRHPRSRSRRSHHGEPRARSPRSPRGFGARGAARSSTLRERRGRRRSRRRSKSRRWSNRGWRRLRVGWPRGSRRDKPAGGDERRGRLPRDAP
jgi:hypothetical protein